MADRKANLLTNHRTIEIRAALSASLARKDASTSSATPYGVANKAGCRTKCDDEDSTNK